MASNYLFHPLGDFAKNYYDGTIGVNDSGYPQSHSGHTNGGIDFNPDSSQSLPVYAMTDGTIKYVAAKNSDDAFNNNYAGYYAILESHDFNYGVVYIRYLEMGYLNSELATVLSVKGGISGDPVLSASDCSFQSCNISVKKGDIIGYTNNYSRLYGNGQSQLHIDIQTSESNALNNPVSTFSFLNKGSIDSRYSTEINSNNVGIWLKDGEIVGKGDNGLVPGSGGFPVYDHYWYSMIIPKPDYLENLSNPTGGTSLNSSIEVPSAYSSLTFSSSFMGDYPSTTSDIYLDKFVSLKNLSLIAQQEFGTGDEGLSYSKLFRAHILYEDKTITSLKSFADLQSSYSWYKAGISKGVQTSESSFLKFMQNMYLNIAYPEIYGISNKQCIIACSNMPYMNETKSTGSSELPSKYNNKELAFKISYSYSLGYYVMYRFTDEPDTSTYNQNVS